MFTFLKGMFIYTNTFALFTASKYVTSFLGYFMCISNARSNVFSITHSRVVTGEPAKLTTRIPSKSTATRLSCSLWNCGWLHTVSFVL